MRLALVALLAGMAVAVSPAAASATPPPPSGGHLCPREQAGPPPRADAFDARELVGLRTRKARAVAADHGCQLRVVRRNGEDLVVTQDFRSDRVNVAVRHRRVKRIVGIY